MPPSRSSRRVYVESVSIGRLSIDRFLPYTVSFEKPSIDKHERPKLDFLRTSSFAAIKTRGSQASLLLDTSATPPASSPGMQDALLALQRAEEDNVPKRRSLVDGRSLVRNDMHSDWGISALNQPRSTAAPLPSRSVRDFSTYCEEVQKDRERQLFRKARIDSKVPSPRNDSAHRQYSDATWTIEPAIHGNGGLLNALRIGRGQGFDGSIDSYDNEEQDNTYSTHITWMGTIGFPTDTLPGHTKHEIHDKLINEYNSVVVDCSDKDIDGHYANYCKIILWPIFHYQVPDHVKSKAYADHSWRFYHAVNEAFADKVILSYKRGDTIWVHDYHLLLVPAMIRSKLPDAKIGFFLHTAFPSSELFRCLPTRNQLLEGMLGADLIGFQTRESASHFLKTCSRLLTVETTAVGVQLSNRFVDITYQPMGINPALMQAARKDPDVQPWVQELTKSFKDKLIIVARDKLDSVHGVRQKLQAYELLLRDHPELVEKVVLIQVASSNHEQAQLLSDADGIDLRIGDTFGSLTHQPLVFLRQDITYSSYLALLSVADVLIVSVLRDGLNLNAHEYVLCQDGVHGSKQHGPVILSEFAGAASVLSEHAININPWDVRRMSNAIYQALTMEQAEKTQRWIGLKEAVTTKTGPYWFDQLTKTLDHVYQAHHQQASLSVPRLSTSSLVAKYVSSRRRLFLIDYEGTIAPHRTTSGVPLSSPLRLITTLADLVADNRNVVYVMSGLTPEELTLQFSSLSELGLIAENGSFIRDHHSTDGEWHKFFDVEKTDMWKSQVQDILGYYQPKMKGSRIEQRHCSVRLNYADVQDGESTTRMMGDCIDQINDSCANLGLRAVPVMPKALVIASDSCSKMTAAEHALGRLKKECSGSPDFVLVAGDDREDELVFRWANDLGERNAVDTVFTVTVGSRNTEAQASLHQGSTGLLMVLGKLAKASHRDMNDLEIGSLSFRSGSTADGADDTDES